MNILVVDDEIDICYGIKSMIDNMKFDGVHCDNAFSANEVLIKLKDKKYDLLITDISMPVTDGFTLLEQINTLNINIRTVIISGFDNFENAKKAIKHNVYDFLSKPVNQDDLLEVIKTTLEDISEDVSLSEMSTYDEIIDKVDIQLSVDAKNGGDMVKTLEYIENNYNKDISLAMVSNFVDKSYFYFSKKFLKMTGYSFNEYLNKVRVKHAITLLRETNDTITEISEKTGFLYAKNFTRVFKAECGCTPTKFREKYNK